MPYAKLRAMAHWLFKSEPESYGFDRLERDGTTEWTGVRNYQARNLMRAMRVGELAFFYHSNTKEPGIAGICRVSRAAHPDHTALDPASEYYDPKATAETPIWEMVDVAFDRPLARFLPLGELRLREELAEMVLLRKGSRLSVQPVSSHEWKAVLALSKVRTHA